jgi:transposase-like protein
MKRLKKRTRVVGVFPNRESCHRRTGALLVEIDEAWQAEDTRYLNMNLSR